MRKILILLALVVLTTANTGCHARFRNWLHRGSPCGTTTIAPAMMAAPMALGTPVMAPQVAPAMAPVMAPAPMPMQQVVVPQPIYCCPQPVPSCPQPVPCYPPCQYDPCQTGMVPGWSGGYLQGGVTAPYCESGSVSNYEEGYLIPGSETPVDSDSYNADPGPVPEN